MSLDESCSHGSRTTEDYHTASEGESDAEDDKEESSRAEIQIPDERNGYNRITRTNEQIEHFDVTEAVQAKHNAPIPALGGNSQESLALYHSDVVNKDPVVDETDSHEKQLIEKEFETQELKTEKENRDRDNGCSENSVFQHAGGISIKSEQISNDQEPVFPPKGPFPLQNGASQFVPLKDDIVKQEHYQDNIEINTESFSFGKTENEESELRLKKEEIIDVTEESKTVVIPKESKPPLVVRPKIAPEPVAMKMKPKQFSFSNTMSSTWYGPSSNTVNQPIENKFTFNSSFTYEKKSTDGMNQYFEDFEKQERQHGKPKAAKQTGKSQGVSIMDEMSKQTANSALSTKMTPSFSRCQNDNGFMGNKRDRMLSTPRIHIVRKRFKRRKTKTTDDNRIKYAVSKEVSKTENQRRNYNPSALAKNGGVQIQLSEVVRDDVDERSKDSENSSEKHVIINNIEEHGSTSLEHDQESLQENQIRNFRQNLRSIQHDKIANSENCSQSNNSAGEFTTPANEGRTLHYVDERNILQCLESSGANELSKQGFNSAHSSNMSTSFSRNKNGHNIKGSKSHISLSPQRIHIVRKRFKGRKTITTDDNRIKYAVSKVTKLNGNQWMDYNRPMTAKNDKSMSPEDVKKDEDDRRNESEKMCDRTMATHTTDEQSHDTNSLVQRNQETTSARSEGSTLHRRDERRGFPNLKSSNAIDKRISVVDHQLQNSNRRLRRVKTDMDTDNRHQSWNETETRRQNGTEHEQELSQLQLSDRCQDIIDKKTVDDTQNVDSSDEEGENHFENDFKNDFLIGSTSSLPTAPAVEKSSYNSETGDRDRIKDSIKTKHTTEFEKSKSHGKSKGTGNSSAMPLTDDSMCFPSEILPTKRVISVLHHENPLSFSVPSRNQWGFRRRKTKEEDDNMHYLSGNTVSDIKDSDDEEESVSASEADSVISEEFEEKVTETTDNARFRRNKTDKFEDNRYKNNPGRSLCQMTNSECNIKPHLSSGPDGRSRETKTQ